MGIKQKLEDNRKRILINAVKYAYKEKFFDNWDLMKNIVGDYIYTKTLIYILRYYRASGSFPIEDKIFINQMITDKNSIPNFEIHDIDKPKKVKEKGIKKEKSLATLIKEAKERLKEVKVYTKLIISRIQNRT